MSVDSDFQRDNIVLRDQIFDEISALVSRLAADAGYGQLPKDIEDMTDSIVMLLFKAIPDPKE